MLHQRRRDALAGRIAADADAVLITRPVNVRYLTGLDSSNAALLVGAGGTAVLCTDARYAGTAERICPDLELIVARPTAVTLTSRAAEDGVARLAFEAHEVTVERLAELESVDEVPELCPAGRPVEELRMVKDEDEIALLRAACVISDRAFASLLGTLGPGMTEREAAIRLDRLMVDLGAEKPAFDTIVASGPNAAIPHHRPGDRTLARGDLVLFDFGARFGGYHADISRTVALGEPAGWQREVYDLVRAAQRAGIEAARPGAETRVVDAAARDVIGEAGHGEHFTHGLGHGVGLEIHEAPLMGYDKTGKLVDRVPITAEPGVYLAGKGGVRIEDTLVVRASGPELLTETTRELLVL